MQFSRRRRRRRRKWIIGLALAASMLAASALAQATATEAQTAYGKLMKERKYAECRAACEKLLAMPKAHPSRRGSAMVMLGRCYKKEGNKEAAEKELKKLKPTPEAAV
jgi:hypothetical protein